jgi:hypothetical protein
LLREKKKWQQGIPKKTRRAGQRSDKMGADYFPAAPAAYLNQGLTSRSGAATEPKFKASVQQSLAHGVAGRAGCEINVVRRGPLNGGVLA